MTDSPHDLAAVEKLLTESDALRGWIARLDSAPPSGQDAVRDRVRGDYSRRLDEVTAGLGAHADVVAERLRGDRKERDDLLARAGTVREGLAEAELRHLVGEYEDGRFHAERDRFNTEIEAFELSIGAVAERISRLEEVQALVERGPRQAAVETTPEPIVPEVANPVPLIEIADLAPDSAEARPTFDIPVVNADVSLGAPAAQPETGPLSFRPSAGGGAEVSRAAPPARPRPFENAPPLGIPAADVPPRFVRPGEREPAPAAPPVAPVVAAPIVPPAPIAPAETPVAPAAADAGGGPVGRTLRCGECGAMNRPLEWYCEKCGAELTAV